MVTVIGKPGCTESQLRDQKGDALHVNKKTGTVTIVSNVAVTLTGQKDVK